ncbi:hypothetical protein T265_07916 [Opisthorchis viverrini]|uniref:Uncharacterized protein n=1 Tax=Opisthorchis viverrini TaxID=6198 RepID=A0A074ZFI7_OPIVI|nr:hypothetical protein T265_07916 [Opisthorchis viverrini]KER24402.1 hypothetical protein T265_07916 [Opisthorchis viverrini]
MITDKEKRKEHRLMMIERHTIPGTNPSYEPGYTNDYDGEARESMKRGYNAAWCLSTQSSPRKNAEY